jgi:hypothetical protein
MKKVNDDQINKICLDYLNGVRCLDICKKRGIGKGTLHYYVNKYSLPKRGMKEGENHPAWKGGISKEPYCELWTDEFRERVRKFWGRRCGISSEQEGDRKLAVHHVSYYKDACCKVEEFNCAPNLFIALTTGWNTKVNHNRQYWEEMLTNYIMIWFNGECYL